MENVLPELMKVISKSRESVRSVKIRHLTLQKGEARELSTQHQLVWKAEQAETRQKFTEAHSVESHRGIWYKQTAVPASKLETNLD